MWIFHSRRPPQQRHTEEGAPSPSASETLASEEAKEALHGAQQAQRDVAETRRHLAPILRSIQYHLDQNEIAAAVIRTFEVRGHA